MGLKSNDRFFIFWATLGAIGFFTIWNLPWRFQVNDDVIMMWLVSGAYTGTPESYAVFIHPLLSWVFSKLYSWLPEFNWYAATWFWTTALSYFLLVKLISRWNSVAWIKRLYVLFLLSVMFHFCFFLQFTQVAGIAAFSSLNFWFSFEKQKSILLNILSVMLFIVGLMIRWESVVLVGLGFGTFQIFTADLTLFKNSFQKIILFSVLLVGVVGSKYIWEANSDYVEFLKFNRLRAGVIDHPIFHQQFVEGQISPDTEFYFFSRWYFEAEHPTDRELLDKKKELDSYFLSIHQFKNSIGRLWDFQKMEAFKSFLILSILTLAMLSAKGNPKLYRFFFVWIAFFVLFNFLFLVQGRVVILFFLCFLIPAFMGFRPILSQPATGFAIFFLVILFSIHCFNFLREAKGRALMDLEFTTLKSALKEGIPLVIEGYQENNSGIHYSVDNPVPFITTGWISRSTFQQKALKRFGLTSFSEIREYVLLTPTSNTEIVFPSYMDYTFGNFQMIDSTQTDNFVFLQFEK